MRYFASIGTDLICNGVQSSEGDVIADNVIEVTAQVESGTALDDFRWRKFELVAWSVEKYTVPATSPLDLAKQLKLNELKELESAKLETFKSSALGTENTYLSRATSIPNDMLLMLGQYTIVNSVGYNGANILWYTVEAGNVYHTVAQFTQVFLDASANVQTVKYHRATLEYQVNAATTIEQVNAIVW